jgi:hypothetical protein
MATPLIRIPQEQGGTMYAFSSAARDLTRAYYNPDINFEYSKFALIDIPVVATPNSGDNYIQFENLFEGGGGTGAPNYPATLPDNDANRHFAQTFQNYALNFENFILNDDDFDPVLYASDSEKIFFKWLNHLGAIRLQTANSQEVVSNYSRAIEEPNNTSNLGTNYSRVVQYIGNIDVSNDKNYQGNVYNEIFINVPSSVGFTPNILFKSSNYNTTDTSYLPGSFINGRDGQTHPDPKINLESIADNPDGTINIDSNAYNYGIEWNPSLYAKIANDPKLNNFLDYSKRGGDFRFNAILVYYDIYSKSNIGNRATNLYGVIILDNWKYDPSSTGWYIPELTKYKPNDVTGLNGNAFALKLNVKFNSSLDNVGVENNINDFTTFSMDIFLDTTTALQNAANLLIEANHAYINISSRLNDLESILLNSQQTNIQDRIDNLEILIEDAKLNYDSSSSILDLITSTNTRVNQIINGEIPTEIQYNTDVITSGSGILIDRSTNDKIKINNVNYGYNLPQIFNYDIASGVAGTQILSSNKWNPATAISNGIIARIKTYDNFIRINVEQGAFGGNMNIYLDDSINSWKVGQTIKFSFKDDLPTLGAYKINIYTDKNNGWVLKSVIDAGDLISNRPYFELICIDEINKTFELEIIR